MSPQSPDTIDSHSDVELACVLDQRSDGRKSTNEAGAEHKHSQSLRSKIVLALALMLGVVVGIEEFVRQHVIATEFAALEYVTALQDANRVLSAINTEIDFLSETARHDSAFEDQDLGSSQLQPGASDRVQWRAMIDRSGNWNWIVAPDSQASGYNQVTQQLSQHDWEKVATAKGISQNDHGELVLFAGVKSASNYYLVGRAFDEALVTEIERRTSVPFTIDRLSASEVSKRGIRVEPMDQATLTVSSPLTASDGQTLAELTVSLPREVITRSRRTTAFARYLSLCGACGSLLILFLLLQRLVIGRLETIRKHAEQIGQSGLLIDESSLPSLRLSGNDEIGQLAESFERMRERLGEAQRTLSDTSHAAGMSLVADTVIHNVGNVLTNVNSLLETATKRVDDLRIEPLEKLACRLERPDLDEAFRKATPMYLHRLSETLEDDKQDLCELLRTLNENFQHIHQVIRDQRKHAGQPINWASLCVNDLIREAVNCVRAKLQQDDVNVEMDLQSEIHVWTDRSLLLQILINLITNAGNACCDNADRQSVLRIDLIHTRSAVRVRFRDNGCGMDRSTLSRVFDAHFTTRSNGSGLGLHFCAIAMKRLGGAISAHSVGPDQGATFIVEVPLEKPKPSKTDAETPDDTVDLQPAHTSDASGERDR